MSSAAEKTDPMLEHALSYARKGKPVFPCGPDKKPLTTHGFKDASVDPATIREWWRRNPGAGIGMPTGKASGLLDFDIDLPDGPESLAALEQQYGPLPETLKQRTGGGGEQFFFKMPDIDLRSSSNKIGPDLDIRANGGYCVLPPSPHESGGFYKWETKVEPAEAPEWLISLIVKHSARAERVPAEHKGEGRPGDDFNERGDIRPILEKHDWTFERHAGPDERWTRPGKAGGTSATLFEDGSLYVFTGNAPPFESEKLYTPFAVFTMLEHDGDWTAATRELAQQGYGENKETFRETKGKIASINSTEKQAVTEGFPVSPLKDKETRKPIKAVEVEDFLGMEFPPRENLLSPWLPSQGLAMVFAPRGVGKTFFSLGVAYAVASGGQFLTWKAEKPHGVFFLDGEMPAVVLQERLARRAVSCEEEPTAPLRIATPDLQEKGMLDLANPEDQASLEPLLDGISLIVVDNLSTLCRTGRENESESWLPIQAWALRQRAAGRSVLFIHHSGKGGKQRGTSKREDVLDTVINLRHPIDYSPDQGAVFEVHFSKARGIYGEETKPFEAKLEENAEGHQVWTTRDLEQSTAEKVAALLAEGTEQKDIPEILGISKGAVSKAKKKAKGMGLIPGEEEKVS